MRTSLLIALAAATMLSSPAVARDRPHHGGGHHERHDNGRDHNTRHYDRHRGDRHHSRHVYVAPYHGWSYRRVPVGHRLRSAFYSPRYFVNNYSYYGLRAPGRHLRWIRYGNDLLLVDIRYGTVIQVLPGRYYY